MAENEPPGKEMFRGIEHYQFAFDVLSKIKSPVKVLEVGAGDCVLKKALPKNISYSTLDMFGDSDYIVDLNKKKIPVKDNYFDVIICLEMLEHVFYPEKVLEELKRVTKKDGLFILSMPNEYNFWLRLNYLLGIKKLQTDSPFDIITKFQHIHKPRVKDILALFEKHFEIKKVGYIWQTGLAKKSSFFYHFFDKFINLLAQIYPSLFTRIVIVVAKKKDIQKF